MPLAICLCLLTKAVAEDKFANWYFEFFDGETEIAATIYSPEGEVRDRVAGTTKGRIDSAKGVSEITSEVSLRVSGGIKNEVQR